MASIAYITHPDPMKSSTLPRFPAAGPELALIAITFVWGATFWIAQQAVAVSGPLAFVAARFGVAAILAALVCGKRLTSLTRQETLAGALIGCAIFGGYGLMTFGLTAISSSKSAFITAFYVPMVPILQWLLLKQRPHWCVWIAVSAALSGLLLLNGPDTASSGYGLGEAATSLGAVVIALEIILISRVAPHLSTMRVTVVQLAIASMLAMLAMPVAGEPLPTTSGLFLASTIGVGCASAIIQYGMNWAQQRISATKATLIYAGEPVWAGLVGHMAGEHLPGSALAGALLIISAGILSEWRPARDTPKTFPRPRDGVNASN